MDRPDIAGYLSAGWGLAAAAVDAPIRARSERDLMFVTWALTGPDDEQAFQSGRRRIRGRPGAS